MVLLKKESQVDLMEELQDDDEAGGVEGGEEEDKGNRQIELQLPITTLSRKLRIGDDRCLVGISFISYISWSSFHILPILEY